MPADRNLAVIRDYAGLLAALRQRREALDLSYAAIDHIAGLPGNYTAKLLALQPGRSLGKLSLGLILGTLGLKLIVAEDGAALARVRSRFTKKRSTAAIRSIGCIALPPWLWDSATAAEASRRWQASLTAKQRSANGRKAARARWRKAKAGALSANGGVRTSPAIAPRSPGPATRRRRSAGIGVKKGRARQR